jgi:hypothetical protein
MPNGRMEVPGVELALSGGPVTFRPVRVFCIQPAAFKPPNKAVILSEALRRSIANRELYGAESKDPGDACWQMLLRAFRPRTAKDNKKSQPRRITTCRSTRQDAQINYLSTLSIFTKQTTYLATLPNANLKASEVLYSGGTLYFATDAVSNLAPRTHSRIVWYCQLSSLPCHRCPPLCVAR